MKLISHRGNINGRLPHNENHPDYIDEAIHAGFDVEIDVWVVDGELYLGHDEPQYKIIYNWISTRYERLWIHCKNVEAMEWFNQNDGFNYFWHQNDDYTLTSKNIIWVYPGKKLSANSICVLPEINGINKYILNGCLGVCSDHIQSFL